MIAFILAAALAAQTIVIREEPVAPYVQADANAGASPFKGDGMWRAIHGSDGVARIVDGTVDRLLVDKRVADIFKSHDIERLRRTLNEQLCYILNGGCSYTGRTMQSSHKDMGIQTADLGALVEDMQAAMRDEHVEFAAQNRLLAKLAAMKRDVVGQ